MISVIVPVYNVEPYIGKCLDSISAQTFTDLEVICVDDGSTDRSGVICDEYAEKDGRILVIHQENRGNTGARKTGLRAASGDFVAWVDSDDWIEPDYISRLAEAQARSGADMVAADLYIDMRSDSGKVTNLFPAGLYTPRELLPRLIYSGTFFAYGLQPSLCSKLIRREILEETQLPVDPRICIGEDAAVVYHSALKAQNILITDICGYHYIQRPGSLMKTERQDESELLKFLIEYLERVFTREGVIDIMAPQLAQYQKQFMLRKISVFDRGQQVLIPYGGIPHGSRVVIYGAGVVGSQIYRYLTGSGLAEVVLWVDKKADYYQMNELPVKKPPAIGGLDGQYDYVLIANMSNTTADEIRNYLINIHVPARKIRWFSKDFLSDRDLLI